MNRRIVSIVILLALSVAFARSRKYWILFTDKGSNERGNLPAIAEHYLSSRALQRRQKMRIPIDIYDIPPAEEYISELEILGLEIIHRSKWLNAVSVFCDESRIAQITALPFVKRIDAVGVFRAPPQRTKSFRGVIYKSYYGAAEQQTEMVGADIMHDFGFRGEGILIGMLDSGFDIDQCIFYSLITYGRLVAKYDFVHNDTSVGYDTTAGDMDYGGYRHGTMTLSCIAALLPGEMVGIAPKASFALAKTEDANHERCTEEDDWIAGCEWLCDSVAVDIMSSSLGYCTFDDESCNYNFSELNGDSTKTTIAADIAARKGVAVFNSAGNERNTEWGYIIAPSDGDSVCAVGAVDIEGAIADFSSPGPSADGRIKPDIVAPGQNVAVWNPDAMDVHSGNGTSFACPIAAGVAALVLQAMRAAGNDSIGGWALIDSIKTTADRADMPDNNFGWGIPKAPIAAGLKDAVSGKVLNALFETPIAKVTVATEYETLLTDAEGRFCAYLPDTSGQYSISFSKIGYFTMDTVILHTSDSLHKITVKLDQISDDISCYPNPFFDNLNIVWSTGIYGSRECRISIYNAAGEPVYELFDGDGYIIWNGRNTSGSMVADGIYIVRATAQNPDGTEKSSKKIKILKIGQ